MLKIVQAPAAVLAKVADPVGNIDNAIKKLIKEMTVTLEAAKDPEGVGLAAPQIGKSLKLFIIKQSPEAAVQVFINPEIESMSSIPEKKAGEDEKGTKLEGCLSLQDIWGVVRRSPSVKLSYLDEEGTKHSRTFTGFFAVIVQHECDHINGILFPRRVLEQNGKLYKSKKDKKGETYFEEISL